MSVAREEMMREIIFQSLSGAEWIPLPECFHTGDEIGFDFNGMMVRGTVNFDRQLLAVQMTVPVRCSGLNKLRRPSFFNPRPQPSLVCEDGSATRFCLDSAKDILVGLYSDWVIMTSRLDVIRRKFAEYPEFSANFLASERERIAPIKKSWSNLSSYSHQLKMKFKLGELSQEEYIMQKRPISAAISELQKGMEVEDPFRVMFEEELELLRYVSDRQPFIEQISEVV